MPAGTTTSSAPSPHALNSRPRKTLGWKTPAEALNEQLRSLQPTDVRLPVESAQYTSADFASLAEDYQVVLSLGRTGQCWDNALAESFFASLKGELIDLQAWPDRAAARRAIVKYIGWSPLLARPLRQDSAHAVPPRRARSA